MFTVTVNIIICFGFVTHLLPLPAVCDVFLFTLTGSELPQRLDSELCRKQISSHVGVCGVFRCSCAVFRCSSGF